MNQDINVELTSVPNHDKFVSLIQFSSHLFRLLLEGSKLGFSNVGRLIGIIFMGTVTHRVAVGCYAMSFQDEMSSCQLSEKVYCLLYLRRIL
jgi:hypothetical protein